MKVRVVGAAGLVFALGAFAWGWLSAEWEPERDRQIARAFGWVAVVFLTTTLAASLVKKARPWRRAFGITSAGLALVHVLASLFGPLVGAWSVVWTWPRYRAGLVAFVILVLLFATSFPGKRFRVREWRALHRLVYVAAGLVVLHVAKLAGAVAVIVVTALIGVLLLMRLRRR